MFDFDEWPATNANTDKTMSPYNESVFKLRYKYPKVFKHIWKNDEDNSQLALEGRFDYST